MVMSVISATLALRLQTLLNSRQPWEELLALLEPQNRTAHEFYIDNTIVDSADYAAVGTFHDDGSAMAWAVANTAAGSPVKFNYAPSAVTDPHVMSDGSTWEANSAREVIYNGPGNLNYCYLRVPTTNVTWPAADSGVYPSVTFTNIQVVHADGAHPVGGKLYIGAYRIFYANNCTWGGSNNVGVGADLYGDDSDFIFTNCQVFRVQIDRDPANLAGTGVSGAFVGCRVDVAKDQILVDHAYYGCSFIEGTDIRFTASTAGLSPKLCRTVAGGGMVASQATFRGATLYLLTAAGAAATTLLDFGVAASVVSAFGLTIMPSIDAAAPAALTTGFAALNAVPGPYGLSCYAGSTGTTLFFSGTSPIGAYAQMLLPPDPHPNVAFPGFLTPVTVPAYVNGRHVLAEVKAIAATAAGGEAGVTLEVETSLNSGLYVEVGAVRAGNGLIRTDYGTLSTYVRGGLRYQFRNVSGAGGVATVEPINNTNGATGYGYTDC